MNPRLITALVAAGALLGGCAATPVASPSTAQDREVLTGSRIAQKVEKDEDGNIKPRPGLRVYSADDLSSSGASVTGDGLRVLSPLVW